MDPTRIVIAGITLGAYVSGFALIVIDAGWAAAAGVMICVAAHNLEKHALDGR